MRTRIGVVGAAVIAVGILLTGCNKNATPAAGGSSSAGAGGSAGVIGTRSISSVGTVLTNSQGFTLYHLTTDTSTKSTCTGSCASTWPPFTASGTMPTADTGVTGKFGELTRPDGSMQLTYDGLPLYTYSADTAPGQANGNGIGGVWFAVKPTGNAGGSSPSGSSGSSGSGRYGY